MLSKLDSVVKRVVSKYGGGIWIKVGVLGIVVLVILVIMMVVVVLKGLGGDGGGKEQNIDIEEVRDIYGIVSGVNEEVGSSIRVISNEYNEQADIVLGELGLDVGMIGSYAASIDTRVDSAHGILVIRPTDGNYDKCKGLIVNYIAERQKELQGRGEISLYDVLLDSVIYEEGGYIVMVIEEGAEEIGLGIVGELKDKNKE